MKLHHSIRRLVVVGGLAAALSSAGAAHASSYCTNNLKQFLPAANALVNGQISYKISKRKTLHLREVTCLGTKSLYGQSLIADINVKLHRKYLRDLSGTMTVALPIATDTQCATQAIVLSLDLQGFSLVELFGPGMSAKLPTPICLKSVTGAHNPPPPPPPVDTDPPCSNSGAFVLPSLADQLQGTVVSVGSGVALSSERVAISNVTCVDVDPQGDSTDLGIEATATTLSLPARSLGLEIGMTLSGPRMCTSEMMVSVDNGEPRSVPLLHRVCLPQLAPTPTTTTTTPTTTTTATTATTPTTTTTPPSTPSTTTLPVRTACDSFDCAMQAVHDALAAATCHRGCGCDFRTKAAMIEGLVGDAHGVPGRRCRKRLRRAYQLAKRLSASVSRRGCEQSAELQSAAAKLVDACQTAAGESCSP